MFFLFYLTFFLLVILVKATVEGVWQYKEGNENTVSYKALLEGFHLNFVCSCVNLDTKYIIWKNLLVLPLSGGTGRPCVEGP